MVVETKIPTAAAAEIPAPSLIEDIAAEFGHLFVTKEGPKVDTSWSNHTSRVLTTHFFSALD